MTKPLVLVVVCGLIILAVWPTESSPGGTVTVVTAARADRLAFVDRAEWRATRSRPTTTAAPPPTTTTAASFPRGHAATAAPVPRPPAALPRARAGTTTTTARYASAATGSAWACIRQHESGGNYRANTGNGYTGAYQADHSTWAGYGGYPDAYLAPPAVQDEWAVELQRRRGWQPWPQTSRMCGLR